MLSATITSIRKTRNGKGILCSVKSWMSIQEICGVVKLNPNRTKFTLYFEECDLKTWEKECKDHKVSFTVN